MLLTPVLCVLGGVYSPLDWTEEEWNKIIGTNLTGSFLVSKHVCTCMRDANVKGSVINISSISGLNRGQLPGGLAYAASKAAVNTMTKVNIIQPAKFSHAIIVFLLHLYLFVWIITLRKKSLLAVMYCSIKSSHYLSLGPSSAGHVCE